MPEILVDFESDPEGALFFLGCLFDHTVQWNVSAVAREIGYRIFTNATDHGRRQAEDSGRQAARDSLQLTHGAGIRDLEARLSGFAACDVADLFHFYRTGEKRPFRSSREDDSSLLCPEPIAALRPARWVARKDGIVVERPRASTGSASSVRSSRRIPHFFILASRVVRSISRTWAAGRLMRATGGVGPTEPCLPASSSVVRHASLRRRGRNQPWQTRCGRSG